MPSTRNLCFPLMAAGQALALSCTRETFSAILPEGGNITYVEAVAKGGSFTDADSPGSASNLPAGCAVGLEAATSATSGWRAAYYFPDDWSGRFIASGNAGLAGNTNWAEMGYHARNGFAAMTTNTGHISADDDASWALDPGSVEDWAHRAMHEGTLLGKSAAEAYYGRPVSKAYYTGCSTGGRQGLKEVQMYPEDFDGVIVGAPAWSQTRLVTWMIHVSSLNLPAVAKDGHIPADVFPLILNEMVRQCDVQDGVEDGIAMSPETCRFCATKLRCKEDQVDGCLTGPQLETLHKLIEDWRTEEGELFFPAAKLVTSLQSVAGFNDTPLIGLISYMENFIFGGASWDWRTLTVSLAEDADRLNPSEIRAGDFDMSAFKERGGKVILWHGTSDQLIPLGSSNVFFGETVKAMGSVDDFLRYFTIPGAEHCALSVNQAPWNFGAWTQSFGFDYDGAPGFSNDADHNVLKAMIRWVEEGMAPETLVATRFAGELPSTGVESQRPFCQYPARAEYVGGNVNKASSWRCP